MAEPSYTTGNGSAGSELTGGLPTLPRVTSSATLTAPICSSNGCAANTAIREGGWTPVSVPGQSITPPYLISADMLNSLQLGTDGKLVRQIIVPLEGAAAGGGNAQAGTVWACYIGSADPQRSKLSQGLMTGVLGAEIVVDWQPTVSTDAEGRPKVTGWTPTVSPESHPVNLAATFLVGPSDVREAAFAALERQAAVPNAPQPVREALVMVVTEAQRRGDIALLEKASNILNKARVNLALSGASRADYDNFLRGLEGINDAAKNNLEMRNAPSGLTGLLTECLQGPANQKNLLAPNNLTQAGDMLRGLTPAERALHHDLALKVYISTVEKGYLYLAQQFANDAGISLQEKRHPAVLQSALRALAEAGRSQPAMQPQGDYFQSEFNRHLVKANHWRETLGLPQVPETSQANHLLELEAEIHAIRRAQLQAGTDLKLSQVPSPSRFFPAQVVELQTLLRDCVTDPTVLNGSGRSRIVEAASRLRLLGNTLELTQFQPLALEAYNAAVRRGYFQVAGDLAETARLDLAQVRSPMVLRAAEEALVQCEREIANPESPRTTAEDTISALTKMLRMPHRPNATTKALQLAITELPEYSTTTPGSTELLRAAPWRTMLKPMTVEELSAAIEDNCSKKVKVGHPSQAPLLEELAIRASMGEVKAIEAIMNLRRVPTTQQAGNAAAGEAIALASPKIQETIAKFTGTITPTANRIPAGAQVTRGCPLLQSPETLPTSGQTGSLEAMITANAKLSMDPFAIEQAPYIEDLAHRIANGDTRAKVLAEELKARTNPAGQLTYESAAGTAALERAAQIAQWTPASAEPVAPRGFLRSLPNPIPVARTVAAESRPAVPAEISPELRRVLDQCLKDPSVPGLGTGRHQVPVLGKLPELLKGLSPDQIAAIRPQIIEICRLATTQSLDYRIVAAIANTCKIPETELEIRTVESVPSKQRTAGDKGYQHSSAEQQRTHTGTPGAVLPITSEILNPGNSYWAIDAVLFRNEMPAPDTKRLMAPPALNNGCILTNGDGIFCWKSDTGEITVKLRSPDTSKPAKVVHLLPNGKVFVTVENLSTGEVINTINAPGQSTTELRVIFDAAVRDPQGGQFRQVLAQAQAADLALCRAQVDPIVEAIREARTPQEVERLRRILGRVALDSNDPNVAQAARDSLRQLRQEQVAKRLSSPDAVPGRHGLDYAGLAERVGGTSADIKISPKLTVVPANGWSILYRELPSAKSNLGRTSVAAGMFTLLRLLTTNQLDQNSWRMLGYKIEFNPANVAREAGLPEFMIAPIDKGTKIGLAFGSTLASLYIFQAGDYVATKGIAAPAVSYAYPKLVYRTALKSAVTRGLAADVAAQEASAAAKAAGESMKKYFAKHGVLGAAGVGFAAHSAYNIWDGVDLVNSSDWEVYRRAGVIAESALLSGPTVGGLAGAKLGKSAGFWGAVIGAVIGFGVGLWRTDEKYKETCEELEQDNRYKGKLESLRLVELGLVKPPAEDDNPIDRDTEIFLSRLGNSRFVDRAAGIVPELAQVGNDQIEAVRNVVHEMEKLLISETGMKDSGNWWERAKTYSGFSAVDSLVKRYTGYKMVNLLKRDSLLTKLKDNLGNVHLSDAQIIGLIECSRAAKDDEVLLTSNYQRAPLIEFNGTGNKMIVVRDDLVKYNNELLALREGWRNQKEVQDLILELRKTPQYQQLNSEGNKRNKSPEQHAKELYAFLFENEQVQQYRASFLRDTLPALEMAYINSHFPNLPEVLRAVKANAEGGTSFPGRERLAQRAPALYNSAFMQQEVARADEQLAAFAEVRQGMMEHLSADMQQKVKEGTATTEELEECLPQALEIMMDSLSARS